MKAATTYDDDKCIDSILLGRDYLVAADSSHSRDSTWHKALSKCIGHGGSLAQNLSWRWLDEAGGNPAFQGRSMEYWVGAGNWLKKFINDIPDFKKFSDCVCIKYDNNGGFTFRVKSCTSWSNYVCQLN